MGNKNVIEEKEYHTEHQEWKNMHGYFIVEVSGVLPGVNSKDSENPGMKLSQMVYSSVQRNTGFGYFRIIFGTIIKPKYRFMISFYPKNGNVVELELHIDGKQHELNLKSKLQFPEGFMFELTSNDIVGLNVDVIFKGFENKEKSKREGIARETALK